MESTDTNDKVISQDFNILEAGTVTREYDKQIVWAISNENMQESGHLYDDAINLAGNGRYNIGLLTTLTIMTLAVAIDIYSFSVVLLSSVCELKFNHSQTNLLMSVPFIGPILMSYVWGYISDTRGRRKSLIIASFISFLASIISAFSPNWVTLGVLKFISTSCSSCAFSVTYALMSESCPRRVRGSYVFIMSSMLFFAACVYYSVGYFILNLKFSLNISFITFTPWRLLVVILAFPFGISCLALTFFYESPKFLLNSGYEAEALELLERIYCRNGGAMGAYPVKKIILLEDDILRDKNVSFLKSLWKQTAPLFKPPLLMRTLQLYYLTAVMYSTDNSFFTWFPFLVKAYSKGLNSSYAGEQGLCSAIEKSQIITETSNEVACDPTLDLLTCASTIIPSFLCVIINLIISKLSSRRKTLMLVIFTSILVCCVGSVLVENNVVSFLLFIGVLFICLNASMVFSYFTDLYPTSYRGMVVSLSGMVARSSALGGTNLVGSFVMTNCSTTFYAWSVYILSGLVIACFLPPDRPKTTK